jgi:1,4-dihydroxy-2-naphthoate octaprenyltransferase
MAIAMLAVCGLAALAMARPAAPLFWAVAVVLLWAYSYPPLRLSYRGWGEAMQGLGVGIVLPLFGFYLQCGDVGGFPWAALVPSFLLAVASNIATSLPDHPADAAVGKHTWPVRWGPARARKHVLQIVAIAALATPLVLPDLPRLGLLAVELPPLVVLALALRDLRSAEATDARACTRFVVLAGAAINLTLVAWIVALAVRPAWGW